MEEVNHWKAQTKWSFVLEISCTHKLSFFKSHDFMLELREPKAADHIHSNKRGIIYRAIC